MKLKKLKPQGENESDNDFSNRKAHHEKLRLEQRKSKEDKDRFDLEKTMTVPPHIASLRRVFDKE